jgi:hypothetical protein
MYSLAGTLPKSPPPFIFSRILWCVFLAFILNFGFEAPWTVRWEAQSIWTVRSIYTTCMPHVNSYRHEKWYGPISAWHVADDATCTNQVIPNVNFCHVTCWVGFKTGRPMSNWHVSQVSRGSPAHFPACCSYFSFQISNIGGPSDQSSVKVDRPINNCHMSMCHVSIYFRPINATNQSAIDTWHA